MTDQNHDNDIAETFSKMLATIGRQIASQFHVDMSKVKPDANGDISETIKPIMKVAKGMLKGLLGQNYDSKELSSLGSMFNKTFLDGINSSASGKDKSPIALAIQLLMNIGVPLLKNMIGQVSKHQKKVENKEHPSEEVVDKKSPGYHPAHNRPEDPVNAQHGQHHLNQAVVHQPTTTHLKIGGQK